MRRGFAPSWPITLGAVLLCALFVRLGIWQWIRGNAREAEWSKFSQGAGELSRWAREALSKCPDSSG